MSGGDDLFKLLDEAVQKHGLRITFDNDEGGAAMKPSADAKAREIAAEAALRFGHTPEECIAVEGRCGSADGVAELVAAALREFYEAGVRAGAEGEREACAKPCDEADCITKRRAGAGG